jgi:hypothetical protein
VRIQTKVKKTIEAQKPLLLEASGKKLGAEPSLRRQRNFSSGRPMASYFPQAMTPYGRRLGFRPIDFTNFFTSPSPPTTFRKSPRPLTL